ncbi:MAG: MiaB/RimO family radical SAM methylthiotransferase [Nitrospirae bacterium]|nr:MAG: MiaB/RimO family radical SAM methylthiotransferase [Nitrospirota bacterium]
MNSGVKELILIAQDITSYGKDLGGYNLSRLLYELNSLSGDFWIRLLYLFPDSIKAELFQALKDNQKVCHYIDLPLQHSEERLLRLMRRPESKAELLNTINLIRKELPDVVLRTSFIVGFPTETDEEFESLLDFVREVGFERLGAFTYSREDGTEAYELKGQVPEEIKQERYHRLMTLQAEISYRKNLELVGKRLRVLVDEIEDGVAICRYYGQAPEIDGVTFVRGGAEKLKVGEFVDVAVREALDYDLEAEVAG